MSVSGTQQMFIHHANYDVRHLRCQPSSKATPYDIIFSSLVFEPILHDRLAIIMWLIKLMFTVLLIQTVEFSSSTLVNGDSSTDTDSHSVEQQDHDAASPTGKMLQEVMLEMHKQKTSENVIMEKSVGSFNIGN